MNDFLASHDSTETSDDTRLTLTRVIKIKVGFLLAKL